jgi:hypothetical protein
MLAHALEFLTAAGPGEYPKEDPMKAFLATVLSLIAAGVLLIAWGLLVPRASAVPQVGFDPQTGMYQVARPMFANERIVFPDAAVASGYQGIPAQYTTAVGYRPAYTAPEYVAPARAAEYVPMAAAAGTTRPAAARQQTSMTRIEERTQGRNWKKTAFVIGGSTATAAGIGGLIGGKKGALIGAAVGGGASTLYEARQ